MKRKTALILSMVMLLMVLLPVQGFAADDNRGLENAIKIVKEKFAIPDDFKFNYSMSAENGKNVWYLNWSSKDEIAGNISVRVDDSGTILSYNYYKPYNYPRQKKFPKVSRQEAKAVAEEFIKKVNPGILSKIKYQDNNQSLLGDYEYYMSYIRVENGVPFYDNNINISVNSETGEVRHYYYNWDDTLVFPEAHNIISMEQAQSAYKEKLGLELIYNYVVEDENIRTYAVYSPKYNNYNYFIDAFTGERVQLRDGYYGPYFDGAMANKKKMEEAKAVRGGHAETSLTPEELKAIEEASKLITVEQAERIARNTKVLELTGKFKLTHSNLSRSWPARDEFVWHLSFTKEATEGDKEYRHVSASVDAKSGEIKNFYISTPYKEGKAAEYDEAASRKAVENFLKEFNPDKFAQTEYDDSFNNDYLYYMGKQKPREYSFNYVRKVNGITFPGNAITVRFDAVNGKVASFDMNWFDVEFPPVDKVISLESAYEKLFNQVGLELQYKLKYPEIYKAGMDNSQAKPELLLVYALKTGKPATLDANTGVLLDYDGKPYKEVKPAEYTDISGHFAEKQITALAEYGISLEGTEFRPDEDIKQKDFFILFSKVMNHYYWPVITFESSDKDIDNLYNFLIREGVVKREEKTPDSPVTREESIKFIIRALKYDEVADIKGIYKSSFKDESSINPDLIGYVAIARGLKIVSGNDGYFYPKNKLTRAEAAVMVYNYLQR